MKNGRVTLLGAGPGDPELLTLLGKRRLQEADVVLYDRLVDPSLLAFTSDQARLINVGKYPHHHRVKQGKINQLLVQYANQGQRVVRLKAGDPYVFGRGGEEAQALAKQGVNFEVIPGITSAIAGLGAVGIPITHRDYASSFHVITGHHKKDGHQLDWPNIAHQEGTLVFLMGMAELPTICQQLITNGKDPATPVAVVQWATQWRQRMVTADLKTITEAVNQHHIGAPALIVIGPVVKLSAKLWIPRPLAGIHLLVPNSHGHRLYNALTDLGATADFYVWAPKVGQPVEIKHFNRYSTILVDSSAAFDFFVQQLVKSGNDLRALAGKNIVAKNSVVARMLAQRGVIADQVLPAKLPEATLELGSGHPLFNGGFLDLYHKGPARRHLPFNLAEFDAVVFPSNDSLADFISALDQQQQDQLQDLCAFTMGESIKQAALEAGFDEVISCPPKITATVSAVKRRFSDD